MALGEEGNGGIPATMLVGPATVGNAGGYPYPVYMGGGQGGGSGFGGFGDGSWIILLIVVLLAAGGGWGNNGNGGGFGGGQPIIINDGSRDGGSYGSVQRGFDQAAIMASLSGIQSGICSGFGDVQTSLCSGFAGVNATVNSGVNTLAQQMYTNQIADMQQNFALQSQFAQCCCDNRLATEGLRSAILSENCADRFEAANNTRDIIDSQTRSTQAIMDKLCALELDGYKRENDNLRQQLTDARFAASQNAQTAAIQAGQRALANEVEQYVNPLPVPSYNVPNPFCCNNNGCGCNGGSF